MHIVLIKSINEQPSKSELVRFHEAIKRGMFQTCNEELYGRYSPNIIRMMKSRGCAGHVACLGERTCAYRILVGRPEDRRPPGRPRHRFEDNIKINFKEVEWAHGLD